MKELPAATVLALAPASMAVAGSPLGVVVKGATPFIGLILCSVILLWLFPGIALYFPFRL